MLKPVARTAALTVSTALAGVALTACGAPSAQDDGKLQVVAAFYPLQYAAERVAGDQADVTNLTQPGMEPHDLQLSFDQVAKVSDADLVLFERHFQTAVDKAVDDNRQGPSVDAAHVVGLEHLADEPGEEENHTGHEHGEEDPHFWQDPIRLATFGDAVAKELGTIDPDHAADYSANAAKLRTDLRALDTEYAATLTGCRRDTIVVNHDAFGYLGKYGVQIRSIAGLSPDAEPTAHDLATLHKVIAKDGITTVFSETLVSPKTAEALAHELGIRTAVLDPLEGLSTAAEDNGGDYLSVMRQNLALLKKANGC